MNALKNSAVDGDSLLEPHSGDAVSEVEPDGLPQPNPATDSAPQPDPDAWREEVAARLARYRTRRKAQAPRYPSLFLPFESYDSRPCPEQLSVAQAVEVPEDISVAGAVSGTATNSAGFEDRVEDETPEWSQVEPAVQSPPEPSPEATAEFTAKIIEFPRSAAIPVVHFAPLADPVFDRPRIVEAPEMIPSAPALGGILMEPAQPEPADRSIGAELRIRCAPISRRAMAAGTDAAILAASLVCFAAAFLYFNPADQFTSLRESFSLFSGFGCALAALLWMTYQLLFLACIGTTPGLYAAGLKLAKFDGSPIAPGARCWRVFASFLSAFSAGLGYLWCFLDQDSLCWHDRITRTSLQSTRDGN